MRVPTDPYSPSLTATHSATPLPRPPRAPAVPTLLLSPLTPLTPLTGALPRVGIPDPDRDEGEPLDGEGRALPRREEGPPRRDEPRRLDDEAAPRTVGMRARRERQLPVRVVLAECSCAARTKAPQTNRNESGRRRTAPPPSSPNRCPHGFLLPPPPFLSFLLSAQALLLGALGRLGRGALLSLELGEVRCFARGEEVVVLRGQVARQLAGLDLTASGVRRAMRPTEAKREVTGENLVGRSQQGDRRTRCTPSHSRSNSRSLVCSACDAIRVYRSSKACEVAMVDSKACGVGK